MAETKLPKANKKNSLKEEEKKYYEEKKTRGRKNSAIQIFLSLSFSFFIFLFKIGESTFLQFHRVSLDVLKALKISVDFIVQCVWLLEHVNLFSYYAKTQRELKHMDLTQSTGEKKWKKKQKNNNNN